MEKSQRWRGARKDRKVNTVRIGNVGTRINIIDEI